jgi:hypothetical protein
MKERVDDRHMQILCAVTFALSFVLVALNGFRGLWYIYVFRFLILFSSIIPIRYVSPNPIFSVVSLMYNAHNCKT